MINNLRKTNILTVNDYVKAQPKAVQDILATIRKMVRKEVPDAEEVISYGMPAFKYGGRILIYIGAWKKHIGLYPPVPAAFKKEKAHYEGPKGNLQFPLGEPMPYDLIRRIVCFRAQDIEARKKK
jgi:uncharacterized protein YdhG (YjbR/CyaY superfamily)